MEDSLKFVIEKYNDKLSKDIIVSDLPEINFYKSAINNLISDIKEEETIIRITKKTINEIRLLVHNNEKI